jgi:hypothetical protein
LHSRGGRLHYTIARRRKNEESIMKRVFTAARRRRRSSSLRCDARFAGVSDCQSGSSTRLSHAHWQELDGRGDSASRRDRKHRRERVSGRFSGSVSAQPSGCHQHTRYRRDRSWRRTLQYCATLCCSSRVRRSLIRPSCAQHTVIRVECVEQHGFGQSLERPDTAPLEPECLTVQSGRELT